MLTDDERNSRRSVWRERLYGGDRLSGATNDARSARGRGDIEDHARIWSGSDLHIAAVPCCSNGIELIRRPTRSAVTDQIRPNCIGDALEKDRLCQPQAGQSDRTRVRRSRIDLQRDEPHRIRRGGGLGERRSRENDRANGGSEGEDLRTGGLHTIWDLLLFFAGRNEILPNCEVTDRGLFPEDEPFSVPRERKSGKPFIREIAVIAPARAGVWRRSVMGQVYPRKMKLP